MQIKTHQIGNTKIAELISDTIIISTTEDGIELLGTIYYEGFDKVIIHEKNITPAFFDLKTGMAGEILQKFSTYRIPIAIVGNFDSMKSKSMQAFISESNKQGHVTFVESIESVFQKS